MWVILAMGAIVLMGAPVALASGLPKLLNTGGPGTRKDFQVRPATISYGMGQNFFAGQHRSGTHYAPLKWTSWTAADASASALSWIDNCKPDCAGGTEKSYPVKLKAWRPQAKSGLLIFTRLTVTYTGMRPSYIKQKTQVWKVSLKGHYWYWSMPTP